MGVVEVVDLGSLPEMARIDAETHIAVMKHEGSRFELPAGQQKRCLCHCDPPAPVGEPVAAISGVCDPEKTP